ncbi:uncharacterized protein MELLADRAFT_106704 [Melampsora larici-populina 98AG31]|uniref:Uncharacterized protein n=1 Tax=Melampsora larici-populina (strain 98AG31 / pathotype 3-4-7) TaxID=747676 RepID=F4RMD1_MELLP|nr:uncharacterized protein MELLADRAFT_106704 [Melampsora larici-populina 98AG31]EGG06407.1 hypothetical protein MELLADRAFT_106704 [Melampsora larici-populina 98AG31]
MSKYKKAGVSKEKQDTDQRMATHYMCHCRHPPKYSPSIVACLCQGGGGYCTCMNVIPFDDHLRRRLPILVETYSVRLFDESRSKITQKRNILTGSPAHGMTFVNPPVQATVNPDCTMCALRQKVDTSTATLRGHR